MNKASVFVVVAFIAILLGVGANRIYLKGEFARPTKSANSPRPIPMTSQPLELQSAGQAETLDQKHKLDHATAKPNVISLNNDTAGSKTSSPSVGAEVSISNSVIGKPFPVSISVQNSCKARPDCERVRVALSELEQEPRDDSWARDLEGKLQDYAESFGPDKYMIRAIECRESLCAIEAASTYGLLPLGLSYGGIFDSDLKLWDAWSGHETDQFGSQVTVTLLIYRRR